MRLCAGSWPPAGLLSVASGSREPAGAGLDAGG
jgi:hypothetical protein